MTDQQRAEILEVCQQMICQALAFAYVPGSLPVYPASRGLKEIEKILERDNA